MSDDLKKKLTPEQYHVTQEQGTEAPFSGKYHDYKGDGMFKCVVCGTQLFDAKTKYVSGTGWPSFDQALPGAVKLREDNSLNMRRTEAICTKCGAHLGHVFDDGPQETTGKRYCINSCALNLDKQV